MCGIVGYVGPRDAQPLILEGLRRLEYRGYDSAGIAVRQEDAHLQRIRSVGKVAELQQLLAGALHEMARVDCLLAGGHSMQGSELSISFAVNGVAMASDGRWLHKRGLAVGDKLVLTKPLGTGLIATAIGVPMWITAGLRRRDCRDAREQALARAELSGFSPELWVSSAPPLLSLSF